MTFRFRWPWQAGPRGEGETFLLDAANALRAEASLPPLRWHLGLAQAAADHARSLAKVGAPTWEGEAHEGVEERLAPVVRGSYTVIGENVTTAISAEAAARSFAASPGHRANLLNPRFVVMGAALGRLAAGKGAGGLWIVSEEFAG